MTSAVDALLNNIFGFNQFRLGQREVVERILKGQSAAAIFPTGSGKSLCYQLPATQLPHLTLLVSPLLALMQDQLAFLQQKGIPAASIDSMQTREEAQNVMQLVRDGRIKILMISVERLNNERFRQFISAIPISLLVVDEAHCISEWGHNFRPDYLKLPQYRKEFNIQQTLLLTATATRQVIEDMSKKFGVDRENITQTGFYRKNLHLNVSAAGSDQRLDQLVFWLKGREQQAGIIYVTLQQTAVDIARQLRAVGVPAQAYHAGMENDFRQEIQQRFMLSKKGVIVATIAFGMGIDKSDIRFVVHYDLPKSVESYAQEIGRAGRDGKISDCLVLANSDNINVLENFVYGDTPEPQAIKYVLNDILQNNRKTATTFEWDVVLNSLSNQSNIRLLSLKTLLVYLELLGIIKPLYSYYADYKFKFLQAKDQVLKAFDGERQHFLESLFDASVMAKTWASVDFDKLYQKTSSDRNRAVKALDYLDQKGMIELQTKQMTQVYQIVKADFDINQLGSTLFKRFSEKESSEIKRIHDLLDFFTGNACLSQGLSSYFGDDHLQTGCGHCSVCAGNIVSLPKEKELAPLSGFDFLALSQGIVEKLNDEASVVQISRFFCGLTTPNFTKIKARSIKGYGQFEHYRFAEVQAWVNTHYQSLS